MITVLDKPVYRCASLRIRYSTSLLISTALLLLTACRSERTHDATNHSNAAKIDRLAKDGDVQVIALGSCNRASESQDYWSTIAQQDPDLWIWLGDIIYGDSENPEVLKRKYDRQLSSSQYQDFIADVPIIGIWDDHDYGVNNGGKEFKIKVESRDLLFDFLDVADRHRAEEGAYQSYTFGRKPSLKVILLDARYFRDVVRYRDRKTVPSKRGTILGKEQWSWLDKELSKSNADIHLIASGIQFLPEEHPYEKWANFPKEREKLLDMIAKHDVSHPILLSGDRHLAEISRVLHRGKTIVELTSSGLTHSYTSYKHEPNAHRMGPVMSDKNFGVIRTDPQDGIISLEIWGIDGELYHKIQMPLE